MKPKILYIDIETTPFQLWKFDLKPNYTPIGNMITEPRTICFASKWEGESKITFDAEWKSGHKNMIKHAHDLLERADALVHWNGSAFDTKWMNIHFLELGLSKPEYQNIDLFQIAKRNFYSVSYKLDYYSKRLGVGKKIEHEGIHLWLKCIDKEKQYTKEQIRDAQKRMERYNRMDTKLLEDMYKRFQPWIGTSHPNHNLWIDENDPVCPTCGSNKLAKKGFRTTRVAIYQRYICRSCKSQCSDVRRSNKQGSQVK